MAQNLTDEYRKFRYYEGVCSSSDFVKEIAKVLSLGVKSAPEKDVDGVIIKQAAPYKARNWDIVYPLVSKEFAYHDHLDNRDKYLGLTDNPDDGVDALGEDDRIAKLNDQINQIQDMVVLRTKTTPKEISAEETDDLSVSPDSDAASTVMYLQIWKPKYLANPEEYPLDAENYGLTPQVITKDMYIEARKSTASVLYDLSLLKHDFKDPDTDGLVDSKLQKEYVDAVSNAYTRTDLFDNTLGILNGLKAIFNESNLSNIIQEPSAENRVTNCILGKGHLNAIKQTNANLYNFLFGICGLRSTFTEADYDLIEEMKLMITATGSVEEMAYYVTLSFNKEVEIFTISAGSVHSFMIEKEYGQKEALETLKPELYSEGRYIPLPDEYLGDCNTRVVAFSPDKPLKFCLDKVVDESILYGTVVLRYSYEKEMNYTDLSSLKITDSVALENNHYCLMRLFDNPNFDFSGPEPNIYDNKGNVTATNSHASPWSKLSWYQDFEEVMMDHLDEDVSVTSVTDGTLLVPLQTAGLTSDTRMSYWINTNNDRFSLIVMGNPALDYERDRHLVSTCYCGRIESFENSINDVSGNFALYTSSSTTPCKTVMTAHDTQYPINRDFQNQYFVENTSLRLIDVDPNKYKDATNRQTNVEAYRDYCIKIGGAQDLANLSDQGFDQYFITLTGNKFFNEQQQPSYMIIDSDGNPVMLRGDVENPIYYEEVPYRNYIYGSSDSRSNQIMIYLTSKSDIPVGSKVYFNFGYYEEKFVIESGITRDIFGNVIDIQTEDSYGKNTSDGVTSVSMYHTRSRAFYQKHHFLFATTEEYMSKVMYGKSSYTGEYYADRIKITHGNDGPRGILSDTLVIDSSSLYPKDELVINKDFEKNPDELEETFTYFPITAPFSPLADGPNSRYGLALKKSEREPQYTDNAKIIRIARNELNTIMTNNQIVRDSVVLPSQTSNGCKIYWEVVNTIDDVKQNWIEIDSDSGASYERIICEFADNTKKEFNGRRYEANNVSIVVDGFTNGSDTSSSPLYVDFNIAKGTAKTVDFKSKVKLTPADTYEIPTSITGILYGYSDNQITGLRGGTSLTYMINDGTNYNNMHEYAYDECYVDVSNPISKADIADGSNNVSQFEQTIFNAHPSKYLNIFFTEDSSNVVGVNSLTDETEENWYNRIIKHYISIPLAPEGWDDEDNFTPAASYYSILQYPCCVTAYTSGITNNNLHGILVNSSPRTKFEYLYLPYNEGLTIKTQGMSGDVSVMFNDYGIKEDLENRGGTIVIPANLIIDDAYVSIAKE